MTIRQAVAEAKEILKKHDILDVDNSATFIINHVLDSKHGFLLDEEISKDKYDKYMELIDKRCKHFPIDRVIGYTDFYDIRIPFDLNTLTPRYETELLVERVIADIGDSSPNVLDMCTGSGCIGLAIANKTKSRVTLSDISSLAITTAKSNAKLNNIDGINFIESNLFNNIQDTFDIIVCNPPYIKSKDLFGLEPEVKYHDPKLALDGGMDGLDFYKVIAKNAGNYLNPKGKIYLEIGYDQSDMVVKLFEREFDVEIMKDLAQINRFIIAKKRD